MTAEGTVGAPTCSFLRLPKWPVKMIATAKRCDKSPIFIKLNLKNDHYLPIWSQKISSAQALKDMLLTVCPGLTGLAERQLFEKCQVCRRTPSERLEAKTIRILAWRSILTHFELCPDPRC
jgi:hypothetical protein